MTFRSGFVALVGRPNAGKSTLTNALVGSKVSITSDTPQTTRHRISAVVNREFSQVVLVDTPGIHKAIDVLGEEINRAALSALEGVDIVAFLVDSTKPIGKGDAWVAEQVAKLKMPRAKILVITKIDLATPEQVALQLERAHELGKFDAVIALSAVQNFNLDEFVALIETYLEEGPLWFPKDMSSDQPIEIMIAEFIREKVLRSTFDEVPHAVGVAIEEIEFDERKNLARIYANIFVERDSQKGIIVGKGGTLIKEIGTLARKDLERLLGSRVFLDLRVKVKKNWRKDEAQIKRFGYGD